MTYDELLPYFAAACIALTLVLLVRWFTRSRHRFTWEPQTLSMARHESLPLRVAYERKRWVFGKWSQIPATFLIRSPENPTYSVVSSQSYLFESAHQLALEITGTRPGKETLRISATAPWESRARVGEISVTVTETDAVPRRIRQSARSLAAR